MKELDFVQISETETNLNHEGYIMTILESEKDIEQGNVISHDELKNEVKLWVR